jgi:hypothetical protein
MYRPTLEYFCKKNGVTVERLMDWMMAQKESYHESSITKRQQSPSFAYLKQLGFPFDDCDGSSTSPTSTSSASSSSFGQPIMHPAKVERRRPPFLGIVSSAPTPYQLFEEGLQQHRQGPMWDCFYLALSDYSKITGTMNLLFPSYMDVILKQFGEPLEVHHLLSWMETQRRSYLKLTPRDLERRGNSATSKVSCLQEIGFDWQYAMEVITDPSDDALVDAPLLSHPPALPVVPPGVTTMPTEAPSTLNRERDTSETNKDAVAQTITATTNATPHSEQQVDPTNRQSHENSDRKRDDCDEKNTADSSADGIGPDPIAKVANKVTTVSGPTTPDASTVTSQTLSTEDRMKKKRHYQRKIEGIIFVGEDDEQSWVCFFCC